MRFGGRHRRTYRRWFCRTSVFFDCSGSSGLAPEVGGEFSRKGAPSSLFTEELPARAVQGRLDSHQGGDKNVDLACLDFLHRPWVEVCRLRQLFFSQTLGVAQGSNAFSEFDEWNYN